MLFFSTSIIYALHISTAAYMLEMVSTIVVVEAFRIALFTLPKALIKLGLYNFDSYDNWPTFLAFPTERPVKNKLVIHFSLDILYYV